MEERRCQYCGRRLHPALRKDAKFCDRTCKSNDHRYRKQNQEPPPNPNQIFCRTPAEYVSLANSIYHGAPPDAVGYILRTLECPLGKGTFVFPVPNRKTKRADGTLRDTHYYELYPFEPPRVPWEGVYELYYWTQQRSLVVSADPAFRQILVGPAIPRAAFDEEALWQWVPPSDGSDLGDAAYIAREILGRAPGKAIGYSLHITEGPHGPGFFEFPPRNRTTWRENGTRSNLPYFGLNPFEPPVVPWAGPYRVTYHLEHGVVSVDPDRDRRVVRIGIIHPRAEYVDTSSASVSMQAALPVARGAQALLPGRPRPRVLTRRRRAPR
ncbi:MAG: hypothetical protein U1A78_34875 [Polyangia bacterium]